MAESARAKVSVTRSIPIAMGLKGESSPSISSLRLASQPDFHTAPVVFMVRRRAAGLEWIESRHHLHDRAGLATRNPQVETLTTLR